MFRTSLTESPSASTAISLSSLIFSHCLSCPKSTTNLGHIQAWQSLLFCCYYRLGHILAWLRLESACAANFPCRLTSHTHNKWHRGVPREHIFCESNNHTFKLRFKANRKNIFFNLPYYRQAGIRRLSRKRCSECKFSFLRTTNHSKPAWEF